MRFDPIDIIRQYFGYTGVPYDNIEASVPADGELTSVLGTPIYMPLSIDGIRLPDEPLISIRGAKRLITTPVDGQEGTFKELFAKDDYRIQIVGVAFNDDNPEAYPEKLVRQLRQLAEAPRALKVTNKLLSHFNINQIVIQEYDFPAVEGGLGFQPFTFSCLSDKTFDLELRNP